MSIIAAVKKIYLPSLHKNKALGLDRFIGNFHEDFNIFHCYFICSTEKKTSKSILVVQV